MSLTLFNLQLKIGKKDYDFEASVDVRVDEKLFSNQPQPILFSSPFNESTFTVHKNSKEFAVTELKTTELVMSDECPLTAQVFTLNFSLNMTKLPARSPKDYRKSVEVAVVPKEQAIRHCVIFGDVGSVSFSIYGFTRKQLDDKKKLYEKKQAEAKLIKDRQDVENAESDDRNNNIVKIEASLFENIRKLFQKIVAARSNNNNQTKNEHDNNGGIDNQQQEDQYDNIIGAASSDDSLLSEIDLLARLKAVCRFGKRFNHLCLNPNKRNTHHSILQFTCADSSQVVNLDPILLRKVNFDRLSHSLGASTTVVNFDKYFETKLAMDDSDDFGGGKNNNNDDDDFLADWVIVPPPPKPEELEAKSDLKNWCRDPKRFPKMPFQVFVEASPGQGKTVFAKEICRTQPWAPKAIALYFPLHYFLAQRKELDSLKELLVLVLKNTFLRNNTNGIDDVKILAKMLEKINQESNSFAGKKRFEEEDKLRRETEKYYEELNRNNNNNTNAGSTKKKNQDEDGKNNNSSQFESDSDDENIPHDVDQQQVPRGESDRFINGTTITNIISRIAAKIISCEIPIVWVVDDLDYIDRFDSKTFIRRFLDEFVSPGGRQSDAVSTIARLTGSAVRPCDSIFCFTRDERKKDACIFYDGIHPSTVYVMERWDTITCKEAFQNMIATRFPPETPHQEILNLVNFVSESNDAFFGEYKRGGRGNENASNTGMLFATTSTSSNSSLQGVYSNNTLHTALSGTKNSNTSFFTGNPYFLNQLATFVHDVVFSVHGNKQEKQILLQESIRGSPIRLFEHFVAMRITNSMLNLVGTSLHSKFYHNSSSSSKKTIYGPTAPEIRRVLDEAGKMAIRLLAALADEGDARYSADCGLAFSALEWMNIPHSPPSGSFENNGQNENNNNGKKKKNGNNSSDESDLIAASKSSANFEAAVKDLTRSRPSSFIKNISDAFSIGNSSADASDDATNQKNRESSIDYSILIKSTRGAILKSSDFAFSSAGRENEVPMPTWCEVLAASGLLIKKEPLLPSGSSATPSTSISPTTATASKNTNDMMSLCSFPIYSFRNRFDLELFAASFLARSDFVSKTKDALPWAQFLRTVWNSLASHVAACTSNDLFRKAATPSSSFTISQFVELASNRYFTAFQTYRENCVDGLLPHQKREHLHSLREYDLHQNATASSLYIELAQIIPPSLLLDSLLKLHGTFVWNLPSHFFWFVDCCGKFGNFEAVEWLMDKISSNKENRRECDEEVWKRFALNAFCAPLNDGTMFKLIELAKVYVPQLQSIEILSERTTLTYTVEEEESDEG